MADMEPEMKQKIDELFELTKENNTMLRQMRRLQRWSTALKVAYWVILIGIAAGAFYFFQPYVAQLQDFGFSLQKTSNNFQSFFDQQVRSK